MWNDDEAWTALCSGATCPICLQGEPRDIVAELSASWVTMQESAPVRGYACLASRTHAVELHDLPESLAVAFMRDTYVLSSALASVTGAVKINYEIHGNSLPHLHMHFFPRYRGDRFEGKPIDPRRARSPVYMPGEFDDLRSAVIQALPIERS